MTTKHTPTPWRQSGTEHAFIVGGNPTTLVACLDHNEAHDANRANAAFIVRCVNAHDELVAALRGLLDGPGDGFGRNSAEEIAAARAALAKVAP